MIHVHRAFAARPTSRIATVAIILAVGSQPVLAQPAQTVTPAHLMPRLTALAHDSMEGRGAGTPGGVRGRAFLESEARAIGLQPVGDAFQVPVRVRARPGADTLGANVIARLPGRRADGPVIVLSAHHDHLGVRGD